MIDYLKDFRIVIIIAIIGLVTIILGAVTDKLLRYFLYRKLTDKEYDVTGFRFLKHLIITIIYILGIAFALIQIPEFKVIGHSFLAGAGVISLVAGLASQQALSNIVSGIFLVIFKPFRINDKITINNFVGTVEDINLRQVVLKDAENNRIIIPNSVISNQIIVNTNMHDTKCCKIIEIGIGYESNVEKALEIMQEEIAKHPLFIDTRTAESKKEKTPLVVARVVALADSSVNLKAWAWAKNSTDGFVMYCDLLQSIKKRFDEAKIDIPYPQRVVTIKNTEN
ncbi:mechanosensitive ion channel-like protein [Flavobacterium sp. 90]|uniref:mechanosensitive ion channel family protein n=1 Tax=unclassified Flavobacterium TaxID=196869 RepID=UPI000EAC793D|nr:MULTISPECIES: mechanosensitive ion channel family protein [unclassified Flavobacterium]RKR08207.1 mechanosensitive ion channel-like protein [Flavobacterium sp. 81]TCK57398.1 mechanosensitive ion channel-like protein [Flavobacterium sp. 90]